MSIPIRIENRDKKFTSRKAAVSFVGRGIAEWTDQSRTAIRFLEPGEAFQARLVRQEQRYWSDVAAQRGGKEVVFIWKASMRRWLRRDGREAVRYLSRAQLAYVAPGGGEL